MKLVILPIALVLAVAAAAPMALASTDRPTAYMERSERTVEAAGIRGLDVDNSRGRVDVGPSADGRLHVVATKISRFSDASVSRRRAAETTVGTSVRDGHLVVTVHYPQRIDETVNFWDLFTEKGRRDMRAQGIQVRLEIQVPPAVLVSVTTSSGDVFTHQLSAAQVLHTASGDVEARDARGAIDARTSSGDVRLRAVVNALVRTSSGDVSTDGLAALDVSTASGDVNVSGALGALRLETASGDIVVADAPAGISAHTASGEVVLHAACARVDVGTQSGDIRVRLRSPLERAQAASVSGSVSLDMVQGTGAELSARSTSGSIDCEMPSVVRQHSDRSLDARLGKGGAPVRLETVSGDVTITSGGK